MDGLIQAIINYFQSDLPETMSIPFEDYDPSASPYNDLATKCGCSSTDLQQWARIRKLNTNCKVHKHIADYVMNGCGGSNTRVETIYKIQRSDERDPFDEAYRILLWHGTKPVAIPGIIQNGFRKGAGGLFGGGIYFADRIAKSAGYVGRTGSGTAYFVLAEVAPGRVYKAHHFHSEYKTAPKGFDSVKGVGSNIPKWKENKHYYGAIIPCGVTTQNSRHKQYDMPWNEYIIYDPERIIVRFVVECSL